MSTDLSMLRPFAVAGLILLGFLISALNLSSNVRFTAQGPLASVAAPYDIAAIAVIVTAFIVGMFYTLGAPPWRAPRSHHSFLEVASGLRSDHCSLQGEHSPWRSCQSSPLQPSSPRRRSW